MLIVGLDKDSVPSQYPAKSPRFVALRLPYNISTVYIIYLFVLTIFLSFDPKYSDKTGLKKRKLDF
jgi:hypothetical protein